MITIDCVWHNDETATKEDCGIDFTRDECETRPVTFFKIDAIAPAKPEKDINYTYIYAAGTLFVAPFDKKDVLRAIRMKQESLRLNK